MVRLTQLKASFLALLLVSAQFTCSAPITKEEEFQSEVVTTGFVELALSSRNSERALSVTNSTGNDLALVGGDEVQAVSNLQPIQKRKDLDDYRRITLVNATPYRWKRTYTHYYQIIDWDEKWPKYIEPGVTHTFRSKKSTGWSRRDGAGEVTYELEGTCKKMRFQVAFNPTRAKNPDVRVKFLNELKARWNPKGSEVNLGARVTKGGVNFLLAGTEDDFWSMNGPVGWMQEQIKDIGHFPLNEITMPRSHHAGMNEGRQGVGIVYDATTLTQTRTPYEQMKTGGVRVLDFRPYERSNRKFSAGHFSKIAGLHHGMIGITLKEIIDDVNRFLNENPGEMVILDIHDKDSWVGYDKDPIIPVMSNLDRFRSLEEVNVVRLFQELKQLQHRFKLEPGAKDVHKRTLNSFVGGGESAVLIHVPDAWTKYSRFPRASEGFVSNRNFPRTSYWSDTDMPEPLRDEQAATQEVKKQGRGGQIHDSQYVLRLATVQYVFPVLRLTELAKKAWGVVYEGVWGASNEKSYPNWISLDAYETEDVKMLAMTINRCLVAGKCGKLGYKAPNAEDLKLKCAAKADD